MKRGQFSYISQSHASLAKFNKQNMESRVDSISKELMSTRPNPKVYINPKSQPKKNINTNPKADEELRKQNKLYEYELKKKINEHSYLCKLLKTKNTSDLSHLDIYSEMNKLSQIVQEKQQQIKSMQDKYEECASELQKLVLQKNEQQHYHTQEIEQCMNKIDQMVGKHEQEIRQMVNSYEQQVYNMQQEMKGEQQRKILLDEIRKRYQEEKVSKQQLKNKCEQFKGKSQEYKRKYEQTKINNQTLVRQYQQQKIAIQEQVKAQYQEYKQQYKHNLQQQIHALKQQHQQQYSKYQQQLQFMNTNMKQLQFNSKQEEIRLRDQIEKYSLRLKEAEHENKQLRQNYNTNNKYIKEQEYKITQIQNIYKQYQQTEQNSAQKIQQLQHTIKEQNNKQKFQIQEYETMVKKLRKQLKEISEKEESSRLSMELKQKQYADRIKEQQNKITQLQNNTKENNKTQLQYYKALGRLIQINNKLSSLNHQEYHIHNEYSQLSNIINILAKSLDTFIHESYDPVLSQNKQLHQHIDNFTHQFKSLITTCVHYINDQELSQYFEAYLQYLGSKESDKNDRLNCVQNINERIISMNAIKQYTSEKGTTHQNSQNSTNQFRQSRRIHPHPNYHHSHNPNNNIKIKTETDSLEESKHSLEKWISQGWKKNEGKRKRQSSKKDLKKYFSNNEKENLMKNINTYAVSKKEDKIGMIQKKYFR